MQLRALRATEPSAPSTSVAEEILGVPVDVATPDMLKERIRAEVETEAVPL